MSYFNFILIAFVLLVSSCNNLERTETNLSAKDLAFIQALGILNPEEKILFFETNGGFQGFKQSGNFLTDQRIASYWIEDDSKEIHSAFWNTIDSLQLHNNSTSLTYASSIRVFPHESNAFDVYIASDSSRLHVIYSTALKMAEK